MLCSKCGFESPDDARYCAGCGEQVPKLCNQCQAPLVLEAQFCHQCGAAQSELSATTPGSVDSPPPATPERRQLTIMFCDLAESTSLSQKFDAEDWRVLLRDFQQASVNVIERYEGYVSRYMGDGILVYFGYPKAHENDPVRAVMAALEIIKAIKELNEKHDEISDQLKVRIGIATGQVIAGDLIGKGSAEEKAVVGETPNLAARLQSSASQNSVLVSESTWNLLKNRFEGKPCEPLRLKGFSSPVQAYQVTSEIRYESQPSHEKTSVRSELIGREDELNLLDSSWRKSIQGEGTVVLLTAEAGVGKSTMVCQLRELVGTSQASQLQLYCSPFHVNTSWYSIRDYMERALCFDKNDDADQKYSKILDFVSRFESLPKDTIPTIATLFSLPANNEFPLPGCNPQELKHRLMKYLALLIESLAAQKPLLMIFEDAHWMDPTTIEFITALIDRLTGSPVMIVITYRPEFDSPWENQPNARLLKLNRLGRAESIAMVFKITGGHNLPENVLERVLAKTDGVPLYIEEFTRALIESDQLRLMPQGYELKGQLSPLAVPSSLQDSLVSRLDRLSQAKDLVQLASVIGRRFELKLLRLVCRKTNIELAKGIEELKSAGILLQCGIEPEIQLQFKHALLQDAAYQSLLRTQRCELHSRIAGTLLEHMVDFSEQQPQVIAHHLMEAGQVDEALTYWLKAGHQAAAQYANVEAIAHFTRGLKLINTLPESHQRDFRELEFHLALGPALMASRGFAVSEVERVYERGRDLCAKVGSARQLFTATWGLWLYRQQHGQISEARKLAKELLQSPGREADKGLDLQAHHAAWTTAYRIGDFTTCCANSEQGIGLYHRDHHHGMALEFGGHDAGVCGLHHAAISRWILGYPDQALAHVDRMQNLADAIDHPFSMTTNLCFASYVYQYVGAVDDVRRTAEATQQVCKDYSIAPQYQKSTWLMLGWVRIQQGDLEDGLLQMREGLELISQSPTRAHEPYFLALLAEAYLQYGRCEECDRMLSKAFKRIEDSGELTWQAEIHRIAAVHAFTCGESKEQVDTKFARAREIAHSQGARSFKLRCAISQVECAEGEDRTSLIRENLVPIHQAFNEGFASADLKKSASLIESIN